MASRSPTCSWQGLSALRKRGQRPADAVWITDRPWQRRNLEASGGFALPLPKEGEEFLLAGLEVCFLADRSPATVEVAQRIAAARPKAFGVLMRGSPHQVVV